MWKMQNANKKDEYLLKLAKEVLMRAKVYLNTGRKRGQHQHRSIYLQKGREGAWQQYNL